MNKLIFLVLFFISCKGEKKDNCKEHQVLIEIQQVRIEQLETINEGLKKSLMKCVVTVQGYENYIKKIKQDNQ